MQKPKGTSNINGRAGSTRNGVCRDLAKLATGITWTDQDTIDKDKHFSTCKSFVHKNMCNYCGVINTEKHKFDNEHLVPTCITKLNIYGTNHPGNLFIACKKCNNSVKGKKLDPEFMWIKDPDIRKYFVSYYASYIDKLHVTQDTKDKMIACNQITDTCHILIARLALYSIDNPDYEEKAQDIQKRLEQIILDI